MKKQLLRFSFPLFVAAGLALTVPQPPGKSKNENKGKNEQQQNKGNGKNKPENAGQGKAVKNNQGNNGKSGNDGNTGNHGNDKIKNNPGHNNNDGNNKSSKIIRGNRNLDYSVYGYEWNRENFRNRNEIKSKTKVTICHKFNGGDEQPVTITVSENAMKAHMKHGDVLGDCPVVANNTWSDIFRRNRVDYYTTLENTREQVYYSQSILDYALQRLTDSKLQLATMQSNNAPLAEIQQRQAVVNNLDQNVSLLETAVNIAAGLLVSRLQ